MHVQFIVLLFIVTVLCFEANSLYIPEENAEEIQNAICSITSEKLEATANATITRQLKGVCTSNELNLKMDRLQTKILQEIDDIKYILEMNGFTIPEELSKNENPAYEINSNETLIYKSNITESSPIHDIKPRIEEILMYNDTSIDTEEGNKYFYYWQIRNIVELLAKTEMYISSPDFFVLGHTLHLQFYPNYVDLTHCGILLKPNSSGFLKKHRLFILNQLDPGLDYSSKVLYGIKNEERIFRVSEKYLNNPQGFIVKNMLIVKLEILLDS